MRKFRGIKSFISALLVVLMLVSIVGIIPVSASGSSNDAFYSKAAELISENWSDDYFGTIILEINESTIIVDGEEKEIDSDSDATPIIIENSTMLPVEVLINETGAEVSWDASSQKVTINDDGDVIEMFIDSNIVIINDESIIVDASPTIIDDNIMLPVSVITEIGFEAEVDNSGSITITRDFQTKRLIVKTNGNVNFNSLGANSIISSNEGIHVLQFNTVLEAQEAHDILEVNSNVVYVQPDIFLPYTEPEMATDSYTSSNTFLSWGVEAIGADVYASYLVGMNKTMQITVAVLDTGVDANHMFLNGRVRNDGFNTITGNANTSDVQGHGTHVAGTIVDCTPNLVNIRILPVKVLGDNGSGTHLSVGNGVAFAASKNVQVINMSLGGWRGNGHEFIDDMVHNAIQMNVTVVVAAGNDYANASNFCPAHIENVITVAAVSSNYAPAWFTNFGNVVDIAAPGVSISSSVPGNKYAAMSGTSMAAPHVAAVVAMYILNDPTLTPANVQNLVKQHFDAPAGWQTIFGVGVVSMTKALPVTPEEPDVPVIPDEPDEPETPDVPNEPNTPVTPEIPDEPDTPVPPDMPAGITLTQNSTSAMVNVGNGVNSRIPLTITAPATGNVTVILQGPGGTSDANDPALYNSTGTRIAYQNNGWGFTYTLTLSAGQTWNGFVGTGGDIARTYAVTSFWNPTPVQPPTPPPPTGITLTQNNTSASANVGNGANGRVPLTVTAPSTGNVTVTIQGPGGTSNANDPALFNSAGVRVAYQNNNWGFTYILSLNAGETWTGFVGTGGDIARTYSVTSTWVSQSNAVTLSQNSPSVSVNVNNGINGRVPLIVTAPSTSSVTVTLFGPDGTSNANDPALFDSLGTRIAYQNNSWGFKYTINLDAGESWNGFVGTGGNIARTYTLTSTWSSAATLSLNPTSVTVSNDNLNNTITAGGTATGTIIFDRGTLPAAVQLSASGNSITVTGNRPAAGQAAITGTYVITVTREGIKTQLSITVNLTPLPSNILLTQNNTSATANVSNGISGRIPITVTAPSTGNVTVTLFGPEGTSNANDPALFNSTGQRIAYQNNGWGFKHTITLNAGETWTGFVGTGGEIARTYNITSTWVSPPPVSQPPVPVPPAGITLTQNNTSAAVNVGNGVSGRIPITVTAPTTGSITVTLFGPEGTSNANDPALFNSTGQRIAYQNNGWGFKHTITLNAGESWSGFVGTGGEIARTYTVTSTWTTQGSGITLTKAAPSATVNVTAGVNGRVPVTITAPANGSVILRGTSGTTDSNDPALYNSSGTRIAFQNFNSWNFTYTIPAGQTVTVFAGTGGNVARNYVINAIFP